MEKPEEEQVGSKRKKKTGVIKEFGARKAERYSRHGRELERRVVLILEKMKKEDRIKNYTYHEPFSQEDLKGEDFTIIKEINGQEVAIGFGVTISARSKTRHKINHPDKPCIHIPFEMRDERIIERIEKL